ncbi:hypothetical protein T06_10624 [Trichinella sp. T6]|nr:hypothetical protein T06_10624 [Trichinella sp. T6]
MERDRRGSGAKRVGWTTDTMALHPAQGAMDGRLLGAPHPDYEGVPTESAGAGFASRRRAPNHPVRSRGLSQRPPTDPCGIATGGTRAPQSVPATNGPHIDFPEVGNPETNWHTPGEGPRRWESRSRYRQQLIAKWW